MGARGGARAARHLPVLSASSVRSFQACRRLYRLKHVDRIEPVREDERPRFGRLFHVGQEGWWGAAVERPDLGNERILVALGALDRACSALREPVDAFLRCAVEETLIAYDARWRADLDLVPLAVEATIRRPLVNPATGRASMTWEFMEVLDGIVRSREDGLLYVLEHKTTSDDTSPGSVYWQRLRIDGQASTYADDADHLGYGRVAGLVYDVVQRPDLRQRKATPAEARKFTQGKKCKLCKGVGTYMTTEDRGGEDGGPVETTSVCGACGGFGWEEQPRLYAGQRAEDETVDEYRERLRAWFAEDLAARFTRGVVVRLEKELDEHRAELWQLGLQIHQARRDGAFPRNPDACSRWGRLCEFFDICTGTARADDPARFRVRPPREDPAPAPAQPELPGTTE